MTTQLFSILRFTAAAPGVPVVLPHGLAFPARLVVPDVILPSAPGFLITADDTNVTVTNQSGVVADIDCFCWAIHTYERAFGATQTVILTPQPFVPDFIGMGGTITYFDPDTSVMPQTVFLTAAPTLNARIVVTDIAGRAAVNNITVDGNGNTINSEPTQTIVVNYGSATFRFNGTEWNII